LNTEGRTDEDRNRCCRVCCTTKSWYGGKDGALTPLIKDLIKNMGVYKLTFFDNLPNSNLLSLASNFYSNRDVN
jgi:hypothetical protein